MHLQATTSFSCGKCQTEFKSENTLKNHQKRCQGERKVGFSTQCSECGKTQSSNFARHRKKCCPSAPEAPQPRKYKPRYAPCPQCEMRISTCSHKPGSTPPRLQSQTGGERTLSKRVKAKEEETGRKTYDTCEGNGRYAPIQTNPEDDTIKIHTDGEILGENTEKINRRSNRNIHKSDRCGSVPYTGNKEKNSK